MHKPSVVSTVFATGLLLIATPVDAALEVRGTDVMGNRLIYDSDFNITWYDYTHPAGQESWYSHNAWAEGLSVTISGVVYDDWRLPTRVFPDPPVYAYGYNGTTSYGYNIASSEMGHLFYTELGNIGRYDTAGNDRGPGNRLENTGPFLNLLAVRYYDNTTYAHNLWSAGSFEFISGEHNATAKEALGGTGTYGIAVRQGDVIPEPAALALLVAGGLALRRR